MRCDCWCIKGTAIKQRGESECGVSCSSGSGEKFFETKPAPNEKEFVTAELPNFLSVIRTRLLNMLRPQIEPVYLVLEHLLNTIQKPKEPAYAVFLFAV